jgi:hypothetical protein
MPSLPWRWIVLGVMTLSVIGAAYVWNERSKAAALRAGILRLHRDTLGEATTRYVSLRDDLTAKIMDAATRVPTGHADRQLKISGLRASPGIYLRIPRATATSPEAIAKAAVGARPDVIASCMGLAPASAVSFFERGEFLLPEWTAEARASESVLRLRVIDDELARRVKRDLPSVLCFLQSRWFLLILEHGPRDREPVDVYLWDLREAEPLLEARIQSRGALLSARIRTGEGPPAARLDPTNEHRSGSHDCSIGAQIKALAGSPVTEVTSAAAP